MDFSTLGALFANLAANRRLRRPQQFNQFPTTPMAALGLPQHEAPAPNPVGGGFASSLERGGGLSTGQVPIYDSPQAPGYGGAPFGGAVGPMIPGLTNNLGRPSRGFMSNGKYWNPRAPKPDFSPQATGEFQMGGF
jgi:hypothetical protein